MKDQRKNRRNHNSPFILYEISFIVNSKYVVGIHYIKGFGEKSIFSRLEQLENYKFCNSWVFQTARNIKILLFVKNPLYSGFLAIVSMTYYLRYETDF